MEILSYFLKAFFKISSSFIPERLTKHVIKRHVLEMSFIYLIFRDKKLQKN